MQTEVAELPAALLIGLYGSIALSLAALLVYRVCAHCRGWEGGYEAVPEATDGGLQDIVSPLSLYCYQPEAAASSTTPRSTGSSPLSSLNPPLQTSYQSTDDEEEGPRPVTLLAYSL